MVGMVDPGDLQVAGARLLPQPLEIGAMPGQPKPGDCERHGRPRPDRLEQFQQVPVERLAAWAQIAGDKGAVFRAVGETGVKSG